MIVYTANFGDYDNAYSGADVVYNEQNDPYSGNKHITGKMRAKMYKILNPENYDIWIDSNIEILDREGFEGLFDVDRVTLFKHPFHVKLSEELQLCLNSKHIGSEDAGKIRTNLDTVECPVYCGGIFGFMSHSIRLDWWSLVSLYSDRDQLTLPFAVRDALKLIVDIDIYNNPYFKIHNHK